MSKNGPTAEAKKPKPKQPKVEPTVVPDQLQEAAGPAIVPSGPMGANGDGWLDEQAARLGDQRLQTVQRQQMASQIGKQHGNQHLKQVVQTLRQEQASNGSSQTKSNGRSGAATARSNGSHSSAGAEPGLEENEGGLGRCGSPVLGPPPPPATNGSAGKGVIQRDEEDDKPTAIERALAMVKAKLAEAQAKKKAGEMDKEIAKSKVEKTAEKEAGKAAKEKVKAEKSAAGQAKATGKEAAKGQPKGGGSKSPPKKMPPPAPEGRAEVDIAADGYKAPASSEEDPAFQSVAENVKGVGKAEKTHAPASARSKEAQDAAEAPPSEKEAKAQDKKVAEMDQAETPAFNAKAFKAKLMKRIKETAPKTTKEADEFKEDGKLGGVKDEMQGQVGEEKEAAQGPVKEATEKALDTGSVPDKPITPMKPPEPGAEPPPVGAQKAVPKPKGKGEVEKPFKQETKKIDKEMAEGNVTEEQLAKSNEPTFQSALDQKKEAKNKAVESGKAYREEEQGQVSQAEGEAGATAQAAMQSMHGSRAGLLAQVAGQQVETKGKDEQERAKVASDIQKFYDRTKSNVERILSELDGKVDKAFDEGAKVARDNFEDYVKEKMDAYKEERYGGWFGWARWIKDKVAGMPGKVNAFYRTGRNKYLSKMDAVIDKVVSIIGRGLTEAKAEIAKGKKEIQQYVAKLPQNLQKVGQDAASDMDDKFDALEGQVDAKQGQLIDWLAQKYQKNLKSLDARIEKLKEANKGLVQKVVGFVKGVVAVIKKLAAMLKKVMAKIASVVGLIINDPIGFLGNLISGLKQGFNNFVSNIGKHLQKGLIQWLTGSMRGVNIRMPDDIFSLPGIFSLVMQILGLSWAYIRKKAVKLLGEAVVKALEGGFEIFKVLSTEGVVGLWKFVKDQFSDLKEMVMDAIKDMIIMEVIKAGVKWVLGLLNPVGAFIKACMAIYEIVMFFVNNAERILGLINAIVDAAGAIARGSISTGAKLVEDALGRLTSIIIGFLASLLGISGLAKKVQKIIKRVRKKIDKMIDKVLLKAKGMAKKLFKGGKAKRAKKKKKGGDVKQKAEQDLKGSLKSPVSGPAEIKPTIKAVYGKYRPEGLKYLDVREDPKKPGKFKVMASASKEEEVASFSTELGMDVSDILRLVATKGWGKTSLNAYMIVGNQTINLGTHENTREEDLEKPERHAEKQLLAELEDNWDDYARKDVKNQIVINLTRSPCADCSLVLRQFVQDKIAQRYDVTLTVRALSLYGGVKKGKDNKPVPKYEGTRVALNDFETPTMKIEAWDVFTILEERGIEIDPTKITPKQQDSLKRKIKKMKTVVGSIKDIKTGG